MLQKEIYNNIFNKKANIVYDKEFIVSESILRPSIKKWIDNSFENFKAYFDKFNHGKNKILNKKMFDNDYEWKGEMTFDIDNLISAKISFNSFDSHHQTVIKVTSNYPVYSDLHKKKIKMSQIFIGDPVKAAKFANDLCKMIENEIK